MKHEDLCDGGAGCLSWHVLEHPHNLISSEGRIGKEGGGGGIGGEGRGGGGGASMVGTRSRIGLKDCLHIFLEQWGQGGVEGFLNHADLFIDPILQPTGNETRGQEEVNI